MKTFLSLLVLLILGVLVRGDKQEKGFNLNFQQNDYQIKFERVELVRYNRDLIEDASVVTFKHNRSIGVVNATFTLKVNVVDELVGIVQVYKFMSNEYRFFPVHFAANACKAMVANVAGMGEFNKCGNIDRCPLTKGKKYRICNWYPNPSKFPPFIPNGQYKIETQVLYSSTELFVLDGYVTVFRPILENEHRCCHIN